MPPGRESVVTAGICLMSILRFIVSLPASFFALTVNMDVPIIVGIPVIAPVLSFKLKPVGSVPLEIDQVIGVVPAALSFWL